MILGRDANRCAALQCRDIHDLDRFEPLDGSPMAHAWEPVRMFWETEDGAYPKSDFARAGGAPAFNGRALDALSDSGGRRLGQGRTDHRWRSKGSCGATHPHAGGILSGRRPDILVRRPDGSLYGINVGLRSRRTGAPIKREAEAINDLEGAGIEMHFVPYK